MRDEPFFADRMMDRRKFDTMFEGGIQDCKRCWRELRSWSFLWPEAKILD